MERLRQFRPGGRNFVPAGAARQVGAGTASARPLLKAGAQWYRTARWQKLRWSVLVRDLFTCQLCDHIEPDSARLVCDHVTPHRGDEAAFWAGPFQCLCKPCHDSQKQKEESAAG